LGQQKEVALVPSLHNLPLPPTTFIGRAGELARVKHLLGAARLLTLTGPPGTGKSRLGLQVGADVRPHFADGVCFVPLAPVRDARLLLATIAQSLALGEAEAEPLLERLQLYLHDKQLLLLLDNFEHLVEAAPQVAALLAACPHLKVLVTSRERLRLLGEQAYRVPPLALPDPHTRLDCAAAAQVEAIALFLQRAREVSPSFQLADHNAPAIAEICVRLDGLPLAIELAAARMLALPPEELLARLQSRLNVLTGGARDLPPRQRTLRATIDWSYNLLDPDQQALFRRLGVFVGGASLPAIEAVCGSSRELGTPDRDPLDGVMSLIGKSLLQREAGGDGEPRFLMLETLREYAGEKLDTSGERDSLRDRHCAYYVGLAEQAEQGILGRDTVLWMRRLDAAQNNLRAALAWSLARPGQAARGLRLAGALLRYWQYRGYFAEGRQWCAQLLQIAPDAPSGARAKALRALAHMIFEQGDLPQARLTSEQSLALARGVGDEAGVAGALLGLGATVMWQGDYDYSRALYEECLALARRLDNRPLMARALSLIGVIHMRQQEYRAAQAPLAQALAIDRALANSVGIADTLIKQASVAIHLGEYEPARGLIAESLGIAREVGAEWIMAMALARLGLIALRRGDLPQAETPLLEGLARAQESGIRRWSRWYLVGLAEIARLRGMAGRAAQLVGASEGALSAAGARYEPATSQAIEQITARVRAALDPDTFARRWAEGRAMSRAEVIACAGARGTADVPSMAPGRQATADDLTAREVAVLRLIAAGKSNHEISQDLVLSRRTVERHVSNIYQKLGARGKVARASATAYALRHGLAT
jgi:predicted ATPase/DNA-binding CsgD family transcriptional regulator